MFRFSSALKSAYKNKVIAKISAYPQLTHIRVQNLRRIYLYIVKIGEKNRAERKNNGRAFMTAR